MRLSEMAETISRGARRASSRFPVSARPLRVGLAFDDVELRAIGLRGERVRWALRADRTPGATLDTELAELLAATPAVGRWPRPHVYLALPYRHASLKRIDGLPPIDARLLGALVREGAGRFFLTASSPTKTPPRVGGVQVLGRGELWAAAYDSLALDQATNACSSHRLEIRSAVPASAVVGAALLGECVEWAGMTLGFDDARTLQAMERCEPAPDVACQTTSPLPCRALAEVGDDAWRWADAYGAALRGSATAVGLGGGGSTIAPAAKVPTWRLTLAASALLTSFAAAAFSPGLAALRVERRAETVLRRVAPQHALALSAQEELAHASASLGALAHFDQAKRPVTPVLAHLARSLPKGSALLSVRLDSIGGTIVALAPSAASVVDGLERTPGLAAPEIVGPVTRETSPTSAPPGAPSLAASTRELERVTIRFRFIGSASRGAAPSPVVRTTRVGVAAP